MGQPIVHGPSFSTYVRSVRLALHEKGVPHRAGRGRHSRGRAQAAAVHHRQPFGKVPAFEHDGNTLLRDVGHPALHRRGVPGPGADAEHARGARQGQPGHEHRR